MDHQSKHPDVYQLLDELDRLEELREDMEELGVRTLDEVDLRIEELSRLIDELSEDNTK